MLPPGIVVGILLARTVSGVLADLAGWRSVYLVSCALSLLIALTMFRAAPQNKANLSYRALLRSTVNLWREEPVFRVRAVLASLIFAAFSTLWSSVALPLSAPPYSLSHSAIGAFGLVGAAGALAAGPAGRLSDRGHGELTTRAALLLMTSSWLVIAFTPKSLLALAIGAILLDLAVQAVHVSNQSTIYPLRPDAGSRLIGGYMVFYSIGSGLGAIASTALYQASGWTAVCLLGATFSLAALAIAVRATRVTSPASRSSESCP